MRREGLEKGISNVGPRGDGGATGARCTRYERSSTSSVAVRSWVFSRCGKVYFEVQIGLGQIKINAFDGRILKIQEHFIRERRRWLEKEAKWRPKMMMVMATWTNSVLESFENGS